MAIRTTTFEVKLESAGKALAFDTRFGGWRALVEDTAPQPLTLLPIVATTDAAKLYAQAVVDLINSLTGRHFKVTAETVTRAKALLRAKVKVDRMLAIVRFMAGKWSPDPKMAEYVQPSTLMRVSNAKKYGEMMDAGPARVRGGGGDFKMLGEE